MSAIETTIRAIKDFSKLTHNQLNTLVVPAQPNQKRSDSAQVLWQEAKALGTLKSSKRDHRLGIEFAVGTTTNPAPHTPLTIDGEQFSDIFKKFFSLRDKNLAKNESVPLHLIQWWFAKKGRKLLAEVFQGLPSMRSEATHSFYEALEQNTTKSVKALAAMIDTAYPHLNLPLSEKIKIYGVFGNTDPELQAQGYSRGPQSNPHGHMHIVALPEVELQKHLSPETPVEIKSRLKFISPFDALFYPHLEKFFKSLYPKNGIVRIVPCQEYSHDPHTYRTSFLEGAAIEFSENVSFSSAMAILVSVVNWGQSIYNSLHTLYIMNHRGDFDQEFSTINIERTKQTFMLMGISEKEAQAFIDDVLSLPPTFGQIKSWQARLSPTDFGYETITKKLSKYERQRALLKNEKPSVLHFIQLAYGLSELESEELFGLMEDRLKDPSLGEKATTTMPGQESGGYTFDYNLDEEGNLKVSRIILASRLSNKNIFNDIIGYLPNRGG